MDFVRQQTTDIRHQEEDSRRKTQDSSKSQETAGGEEPVVKKPSPGVLVLGLLGVAFGFMGIFQRAGYFGSSSLYDLLEDLHASFFHGKGS